MRAVLGIGLLVVLPSACFILCIETVRWVAGGEAPWVLRPLLRRCEGLWGRLLGRRAPEPIPAVLIAMELRRLEAEVHRVEAGDAPHRAMRLRATLAAYDQLLLQLCENVGVATDVGLPPLPSGERLALEAELVAAGHDW